MLLIKLLLIFCFVNNVSDFEIFTYKTILKYRQNIFQLKRNCFRYYFKDDQQQEYIRTSSEQLESMFANFFELVENNLFTAALEKLMPYILSAAEGMKQSTVK